MYTVKSLKLTQAGAERILQAAVANGHCVGGIGVSGGTGQQDTEVAQAGLAALG